MDSRSMPELKEWKVVVSCGLGNVRAFHFPNEQAAEVVFRKKRFWLLSRILVDPDGKEMCARGFNRLALKSLRRTLAQSHTIASSADAHNDVPCQVSAKDVSSQGLTEGGSADFHWTSKVHDMPTSLVNLLQVGSPKAGDFLSPAEVNMLEELQPEIFKAFVENEVLVNYNPQVYVISCAKGKRGRRCNGKFTATRTHNGRPLFKEQHTGAIMYWSNCWKINFKDSTAGWLYAVPGSDGQDPPPGEWNTHGYTLGDAGHGITVHTEEIEVGLAMGRWWRRVLVCVAQCSSRSRNLTMGLTHQKDR